MDAVYTLVNVEERMQKTKTKFAGYLEDLEAAYAQRCKWRREQGILAIGVCGMGRAGKDTCAEFLCARTRMKYPGSASRQVLPLVADFVGINPEQAWQERHQHREFWIDWCHAFSGSDYGQLVRMCLGAGDIAVGIRGRLELYQVITDQTIALTLWIDNLRVPSDPTVEYNAGDCDLVVPNHGSLTAFYGKLHRLLRLLHEKAFNYLT